MKISVLIPCYNEEKGVGKVIDAIPFTLLKKQGYTVEVIVIDNASTDDTSKIAAQKGAKVIYEEKRGKGNAIRAGFNAVSKDVDFVVMLDGDNSYSATEIPRIIEPLANDFSDVIVGSRLGGKIKKGSLKFTNRLANWSYTFLVRQFYRANITDVLSGYFGWKKKVVDRMVLYIESDGFSFEMEMIAKVVKMGYEVHSVPITYNIREGESKIEPLKDGFRIFYVFVRNLFWSPKRSKKNIDIHLVLDPKN